jgi:predicted aldo/keto reductase-like oxidoreductase
MNTTQNKNNAGGQIPKRKYGSGQDMLSVVGLGGIVVMNEPQENANRIVARAVERGINYFDVAPSYGDAEIKLGPALEPYRNKCFLACKTACRDAQSARAEFEQSLKNLKTDHFDLYQLHGLIDVQKDVDAAFASGGAMELLTEAKKAGQIRHLGFSAHTKEAAIAAMQRYDFDSVLFPLNFACWHKNNFGPEVVTIANEKGLTVLALKSMAFEQLPENAPKDRKYNKCWYQPITDPALAARAMHFTLSLPGLCALIPPGHEELFELAVDIAVNRRYEISPEKTSPDQLLPEQAEKLKPIFP